MPGENPVLYPKNVASCRDCRLGKTPKNLSQRSPCAFSLGKIRPQRGHRCRRDRPLSKPLCAAAALIQARRAKQLSSAYKESSSSLDPRMGAA